MQINDNIKSVIMFIGLLILIGFLCHTCVNKKQIQYTCEDRQEAQKFYLQCTNTDYASADNCSREMRRIFCKAK